MANTWKRSKRNQGPKKQARRKGALERLKAALKNPRFQSMDPKYVEAGNKRRHKEIATLEQRLGIAA